MGCPDCQNGQFTDPYKYGSDRYGYSDYDDYSADWSGSSVDFTEADGERLVKPQDHFEDDFSAS